MPALRCMTKAILLQLYTVWRTMVWDRLARLAKLHETYLGIRLWTAWTVYYSSCRIIALAMGLLEDTRMHIFRVPLVNMNSPAT